MVASFLLFVLFQVEIRKISLFPCRSASQWARRATSSHNDVEGDAFEQSMRAMGFPDATRLSIHEKLRDVGISDSSEIVTLGADFQERPEVFSSLLQTDFGFDPISAHRTRAAVMNLISASKCDTEVVKKVVNDTSVTQLSRNGVQKPDTRVSVEESVGAHVPELEEVKRPLYKSAVVNEKARKRRSKAAVSPEEKYDYGLPRNYRDIYLTLGKELQ